MLGRSRRLEVLAACVLSSVACGESKSADDVSSSSSTAVPTASQRATAPAAPPTETSVVAFYSVDDEADYFTSFATDAPESEVEVQREGGTWASGSGVRAFVLVHAAATEARRKKVEEQLLELVPKGRTIGWAPLFKARANGETTRTGARSYVLSERFLTERDIAEASIEKPEDPSQNVAVQLRFTPEGARKIQTWSTKLTGRRMAVVSGGEVHSAPFVTGPISGDSVVITMGGHPKSAETEAEALVAKIRATPR